MSRAAQRKSHPMLEIAAFVSSLRSAFGASVARQWLGGKRES